MLLLKNGENTVIRSILHIQPEWMVISNHLSEYEIDSVWPEALLFIHKPTAQSVCDNLNSAYKNHKNEQCSDKYRLVNNTTALFYDVCHRVPLSVKNLMKLEDELGAKVFDRKLDVI